MVNFTLLPVSLLALLFAHLAVAAPSSPNDPLHGIAAQVHEAEDRVCCLQPLEPVEPASEDDILLSFEEWKAKRLTEGRGSAVPSRPPAGSGSKPGKTSPELTGVNCSTPTQSGNAPSQGVHTEDIALPDERAPHFRVPLTDRFNYASLDCSARVHAAHKSAKSTSSILSDKKDRYMLGPCDEPKQFVVVELCDDIRIDTVQLANYEFFSGVLKDFTVSVAKTYVPDPAAWTFAGTYRARNIRGVQSFHPPPTLRDFYRFIRIDFHSHYGNEYYCPISLLRVYGLTHLEEWKWDMWTESVVKRSLEEASAAAEAEPPQVVHVRVSGGAESQGVTEEESLPAASTAAQTPVSATLVFSETISEGDAGSAQPMHIMDKPQSSQEASLQSSPIIDSSFTSTSTISPAEGISGEVRRPVITTLHDQAATSLEGVPAAVQASSDLYDSYTFEPPSSRSDTPSSSPHQARDASHDSPKAHTSDSSSPSHTSSTSSVTVTLSAHPAPPLAPVPTGGESIYRTIMNRLMTLEANTTLYARYVEEQTAYIREMLRHLTEDVGRLEGLGKAQAQAYQRSVRDFERDRRRIESEYVQLLAKVNHLTDEVILEKRLGIAQLCLLLAVLVFLSLTRGSRGEAIHPRLAMRELGRRTLSISNSWVDRLKNRSATPPTTRPQSQSVSTDTAPTFTPASPSKPLAPFPIRPSPSISIRKPTRPRTPTSARLSNLRYHNTHTRSMLTSPSSPRPRMQRSASGHGIEGLAAAPRSAKRFARSAHLHEVKSASGVPARRLEKARENDPPAPKRGLSMSAVGAIDLSEDLFGSESGVPTPMAGKQKAVRTEDRMPLSPLRLHSSQGLPSGHDTRQSLGDCDLKEGDDWVDTDTTGSDFE